MKLFHNTLYIAVCVTFIASLQGCWVRHQFSGNKGDFSFIQTGCMMSNGQYTDTTGNENRFPHIHFIAVREDGRTLGEWTASCKAVAPYGTSDCRISISSDAFEGGGGLGCPDYKDFRIVRE